MRTCAECKYWRDDPEVAGTAGACFAEPSSQPRDKNDPACRYFESGDEEGGE